VSTVKAIVQDGQAVVDLSEYPDGTEVEFSVIDAGNLSRDELAELDDDLARSRAELDAGEAIPAQRGIDRLNLK